MIALRTYRSYRRRIESWLKSDVTGTLNGYLRKEMFVIVGSAGRRFGVPLIQLDPVKPDKATREAMDDWRYWMAIGYEF